MGGESFAIYDGGVTVPWHSYRAKLFNRFKAGCLPRQKAIGAKTLNNKDGQAVKCVNGTETGAYSCAEAVPSTNWRAFACWYDRNRGDWPADLATKAERALLSLQTMEADLGCDVLDAMNKRDLQAFVEAYEAFRANSVSGE
jgi:hypothetical protein